MLKENKFVVLAILLVVIIYLLTYPVFYASSDEYSYVRAANLLSNGTIFEEDILYSAGAIPTENGYVPNVQINFPLFLFPFLLFGFSFIFVSGLIFHLLNILIFSSILKEIKVSQKFVFLYAFFPALFWMSRTLYPQNLAITFLLLGFLVYIKSSHNFKETYKPRAILFLSGLFFGMAVFIRVDLVIAMALLLIVVLFKKRSNAIFFIAGLIPPALAVFASNAIQFGSALATGYGTSGSNLIIGAITGISVIDLVIFGGALLICYPLMFLAGFYKKGNTFRLEILALFFGALIIQSSFSRILHLGVNPFSFYFINLRYLSVGIPFLIIAYSIFLENYFSKKFDAITSIFTNRNKILGFVNFKNVFCGLLVVLILVCFAFSFVHYNFALDKKSIMDQVYLNTPEDALVVGSSDDKLFFMKDVFSDRRYVRVDIWNDFGESLEGYDIKQHFDDKTYIMLLGYSNREGKSSHRQVVTIDKERGTLVNFINDNNSSLDLIFETTNPHNLQIYKWVG